MSGWSKTQNREVPSNSIVIGICRMKTNNK